MKQIFLPKYPEISVLVRHSARARRLSLRISSLDGKVTLSGPPRVPENEYLAFVTAKQDWIAQNLSSMPRQMAVVHGGQIAIAGQMYAITTGAHRGVRVDDGVVSVGRAAKSTGAAIKGFLKVQARDALARSSDHYAAQLGVRYSSLVLRDTRSRWGSCSSQGQLMYSWRLIMAPPEILNYVAAHEVAHLVEMNHSDAFWSVVRDIYPDYATARMWLRKRGAELHRYDFDA